MTYSIGCDDTRAVGTHEARFALAQKSVLDLDHVMLRNTFSDCNDQRHLGFKSFKDGLGSSGRWDVDDCGLGTSSSSSFSDLKDSK
jgi:hypothetical protein